MEEKETLYIPQGLKVKPEIFEGFGKEELVKSITSIACFGFIDTIAYMIFKNTAVSVVFFLTAIAGTIMMLTKDRTNSSVVDQVWFMIRFAKSQKIYKYKTMQKWRIKEDIQHENIDSRTE